MSAIKASLAATVSGTVYAFDLEVVDSEGNLTPTARGLLDRGIQKILTDAHSTATRGTGDDKRKATDAERAEDVAARLEKVKNGTYNFGGGGSRLGNDERALRHAIGAFGCKLKKADSTESGLEKLAQIVAEKAGKDYEPGMAETIREQIESSEVYTSKLEELNASKPVADTAALSL